MSTVRSFLQTLGKRLASTERPRASAPEITRPRGARSPGPARFYDDDEWNAALSADPGEMTCHVPGRDVEGVIPAHLVGGAHVQNGPGRMVLGGRRMHPLDGHGYLRAFRFDDDGVRFQSTYVQTAALAAETAANRLLYAGVGTLVGEPGAWDRGVLEHVRTRRARATKNVANATIQPWAGRLLAGWDGGAPHALDVDTLATLGVETLGGALEEQPCVAHMRVDTTQHRLVLLSPKPGMNTELTFRELAAGSAGEPLQVVTTRTFRLPGASLIRDFAMTRDHFIVCTNRVRVDIARYARAQLGLGTLLQAMAAENELDGELIVLPRDGEGPPVRISLHRPLFVQHFANAFVKRRDKLTVDVSALPAWHFGREFGFRSPDAPLEASASDGPPLHELLRCELDLDRREVKTTRLCDLACDFPRVNPEREGARTKHIFAAARSDPRTTFPFDAVVKVDAERASVERWVPGDGGFVSGPLFVPRPGAVEEDDGHVLVVVTAPRHDESALCILDARDIERGPVARVRAPALFPLPFHTAFLRGRF